jgi:hypothetical protein
MFQRPGFDGEVFFDRKKRYSLNAQIVCDCDKYITMFSTGWPGSTGNIKSYKRMQLHLDPTQFFDKGKLFIIFSQHCLYDTYLSILFFHLKTQVSIS